MTFPELSTRVASLAPLARPGRVFRLETARWLGLRRRLVPSRFFSPSMSRLWVSLVTGMPRALVYPLIESLRHEMVARPDHLYGPAPERSYAELLRTMPPPARPSKPPSGSGDRAGGAQDSGRQSPPTVMPRVAPTRSRARKASDRPSPTAWSRPSA